MFFTKWLRNRNVNPKRQRTPRARPRLEMLEDRAMLATMAVTTTADVLDPADGLLSLREAVLQANASVEPDTVVVPAGTYTFSIAGYDDTGLAGDLDLAGDLRIRGAGARATVIDAAGVDGVFYVPEGANVALAGMAIRGGVINGGILNWGTLTVRDAVISDNSGNAAGGISNAGT